jgi:hypothetical protein
MDEFYYAEKKFMTIRPSVSRPYKDALDILNGISLLMKRKGYKPKKYDKVWGMKSLFVDAVKKLKNDN